MPKKSTVSRKKDPWLDLFDVVVALPVSSKRIIADRYFSVFRLAYAYELHQQKCPQTMGPWTSSRNQQSGFILHFCSDYRVELTIFRPLNQMHVDPLRMPQISYSIVENGGTTASTPIHHFALQCHYHK
jgi:hypothetical protein